MYDVDPDRITLMGHSAGGHLALLAAYGDAIGVRAVVNVYGPCDLEALHRRSGSRRYIDRCLRAFAGGGSHAACLDCAWCSSIALWRPR